MDDELKKRVRELYLESKEEGIEHLTLGCFYPQCDILKCRHPEFNSADETDNRCCPNYKDKCRNILDAVFRDVYGEENRIV